MVMKKIIVAVFMVIMFAGSTFAFWGDQNSVVDVVKKTRNGVVNISTTKIIKRKSGNNTFNEDMFRRFFGDQFKDFHQGQPKEYKSKSLGSGFIIDENGYIITNNHVIENADEIIVNLYNGKDFEAKVIGRDPLTDLALLKIDVKGETLHPLALGDSKGTQVGEVVVAIGNPFGLESTVTAGIVSAKGRELGNGPYDNFMQTDASINPGNSGGPLVNLNGEVVGINTAIIASAQGLGFAIPVNMLKELLPKLKKGSVKRGWLGVVVQPLDKKLAKLFGLDSAEGALISDVVKGDPAERAGLKAGDIVLAIDENTVTTHKDLINIIGRLSPGHKAKMLIVRDGKEMTIVVELGLRGGVQVASKQVDEHSIINVSSLSDKEKQALKLNIGVKINSIQETSNAFEAGVRKGNVIVWLNRKTIDNANSFYNQYDSIKKGDVVAMKILSKQGSRFIAFSKD